MTSATSACFIAFSSEAANGTGFRGSRMIDPDCFDLLDDLARSRDRDIKEAAEIALDELAMHQDAEEGELEDEFDED